VKILRLFCALTLMAGACLTARAAYLHAKAELAKILIRHAWNETVQSGKPHPPWPWADTYPIAHLRIPRVGYDEFVLDGATPRTLAFGPARMFSGAAMGEPGNVVLAGHRTSWFRPLEGIAQEDTIQLEWSNPRSRSLVQRTYSVTLIRVVEPTDVDLLTPTSDDALTLITCYPFGRSPYSPQRFVVRGIPMESISPISPAGSSGTRETRTARSQI